MSTAKFPMTYTAPSFTEEDYEQEIRNLTAEHAYDLDSERRGINSISRETTEMRANGLRDIEAALSTMTDKFDYVRACEVAPSVVQRESDPLFFLRCEDYDANAAAVRLIAYWKMRCKIFGERAFRPLTQSGDDALTAEDVEDLSGGSLQLLEPDDMGRPIIYFRRGSLNMTDIHRPVLPRNLMYLYALICKDPVRQRHGYVIIVDTMGYTKPSNDRKASKLLIETLKYAAPIRLRCIHICYPEIKCVARLFLPTILWFLGEKLRPITCIHNGGPKELMFDLALYGMDPLTTPVTIGGKFSLELWQEAVSRYRADEVISL